MPCSCTCATPVAQVAAPAQAPSSVAGASGAPAQPALDLTRQSALEPGERQRRRDRRAMADSVGASQAQEGARLRGAAPTNLIRPVAGGSITSHFGEVSETRGGTPHHGTDFAVAAGTPIKAAADGVVESSTYDDVYGRLTIIRHAGGMRTVYAHQNSTRVTEGESIAAGQVIGTVGSTGRSTGPHLHFEVRMGASLDDAVNAEKYL